MEAPLPTDTVLAAALTRRDPGVLGKLYRRHADGLTIYAQAIARYRELAEEAVQETFCEILRSPERFAASQDIKRYLFGAVRLSALCVRRRHTHWRRFAKPLSPTPWLEPAAEAPEPPETLERLAQAVAELPEPEREAVTLKIYGRLTFLQMGKVTSMSPKTLESRYYAALEQLRARLNKNL